MKYSIKKNWGASLKVIAEKPAIILPFIIIAFLQVLALEILYFFPRWPLSAVAQPIVRKFFGEMYLHYPGSIFILPNLYYYFEVGIFIIFGVVLSAVSINIFKNVKTKVPLTPAALVKNALKKYVSFVLYGILLIGLTVLMERGDRFLYAKVMRFAAQHFPNAVPKFYTLGLSLFLFVSSVIMQVFLVLTVPLIVLEKKSFFTALGRSIFLGFRHFFRILALISLPFLVYLPIILIRTGLPVLANKTFPEIVVVVSVVSILIAMLLDCFLVLCASQFLWDTEKESLLK
ncbi:MAG: hypothetical protein ABH865_07340 [Candidatus Omnitrophota bacterium]